MSRTREFGHDTTAILLDRVRAGDLNARDRLVERYLPALTLWAHGRLPSYARDLKETDDLVQIALMRALNNMERFEPRWPGAFLAYLRRIVLNEIKDEIRRVRRIPGRSDIDDGRPDEGPSPVEQAIGKQALERYERALEQLPAEHQEAIVMRVEMGFSYEKIAEATGSPSPNAARMMVSRALARLAEALDATQ